MSMMTILLHDDYSNYFHLINAVTNQAKNMKR